MRSNTVMGVDSLCRATVVLVVSVAIAAPAVLGSARAQSDGSAASSLVITGRVVAARQGSSALVAGTVQILALAPRSRVERLAAALRGDANDLPVVASTYARADGSYTLHVEPDGPLQIRVLAPGHVAMQRGVLPVPTRQHLAVLHLWPATVEQLVLLPPETSGQLGSRETEIDHTALDPARLGRATGRSWVALAQSEPPPEIAGRWFENGWSRLQIYGWTTPRSDGVGQSFEFQRAEGERLRFVASNAWGRESISVGPHRGPPTVRHAPRPPPHEVTLRVRDASGAAVAGGVVTIDGRPAALSDSLGESTLMLDPGARVEVLGDGGSVSWTASSQRPARWHRSSSESGTQSTVELQLEPWPELSGTVRSADSSAPLGGAWLIVGSRGLRTDSSGRFRVRVSETDEILAGQVGFQWSRIGPQQAASGEPVGVELRRAAWVEGRVFSGTGQPLAGIELVVSAVDAENILGALANTTFAASSGRDGSFRVLGLAAGEAYDVAARPQDGRKSSSSRFTTSERGGGADFQRVVVRWPRPAIGWVIDSAEQPVEGAEVHLLVNDAGSRPERSRPDRGSALANALDSIAARSDGEGRFRVADLPSGTVDVLVRARGHAPASIRDVHVEPMPDRPANQPFELGTVILGDAVELELRLRDMEGTPIEGATVLYRGSHPRWPAGQTPTSSHGPGRGWVAHEEDTDSNGTAVLNDLGAEELLALRIVHPEFVEQAIDAISLPSEEPVEIEMVRAAMVSGIALDERSAPLEDAHVALRAADATIALPSGLRARTASDGRFTITGVPPGRLVAWGRAAGSPDFLEVALEVAVGAEINDVILRVPPTGRVRGTVTQAGRPLANVRVRCCGQLASTDALGRYELRRVAAGSHQIVAEDLQGGETAQRFVARADEETVVDLELERGLLLAGRVRSASGEVLQSGTVRLRRLDPPRAPTRRVELGGADGRFAFHGVAAGKLVLTVDVRSASGVRSHTEEISLEQSIDDYQIVVGGEAAIQGRVLGLEVEELPTLQVSAVARHSSANTRVTPDRRFQLSGLEAGEWMVSARRRNGTTVRRLVELGPAEQRDVVLRFEDDAIDLRIAVRVDGRPAASWIAGYGPGGQTVWESINALGRGEFEGLEPGDWTFSIADSGAELVPVRTERVDVDREMAFDLERVVVQGRVVDTNSGAPVSEARVSIASRAAESSVRRSRRPVASDGSFVVEGLVEGSYVVFVEAPGYRPARVDLIGSTADVELRLTAASN